MAGRSTDYAGRKVLVVGAGREGVSSACWFKRHGADVTVGDRMSHAQLRTTVRDLQKAGITTFRFGRDYLKGITDYEIVVRTPLRPYFSPEIQRAVKAGVTVTSQTKVFFERCPARIVGVTGTKGKGTTSSLIARMFKAGYMGRKRVWLGGNIGRPMLNFLDYVKSGDTVVLELSSYQLQDLDRSPQVAVVTNVTADHLDYHRSLREYRGAKRSITKYQRRGDLAVLNADDPGSKPFAGGPGRVRWFSTRKPADALLKDGWLAAGNKRLLRESDLQVPGEHNRANVLAAALAASACGVGTSAITKAAKEFRGLPYHLEYLGAKGGVRYFNDSYATSETAATPAVASIDTPLVLIVGGQKKGLRFEGLAEEAARKDVRGIVAMPLEGEKIVRAFRRAFRKAGKPMPEVTDIRRKQQIVPAARKLARKGDTVLFSPAATSFGWFKSYTDRGRFFTEQVKRIPS
ncbi:MAG TPA: UDP-N-acetylmuramoyl-L-alanine--D-glutamate ligase [Patescibacteria group bacterium]|jgi:UDP-N-acetylmuramoylalanine--D-glutamate ligase